MKVALVHDWITGLRGGERCLKVFLELYPDADIFTLLHIPGRTYPEVDLRVKQSSFLQSIPYASKLYRYMLPLYPRAISKFDFRGYDLVISLSHAAAKNINVPANIPHICYCFTPMRYIWDQSQAYFGRAESLLNPVLSMLRSWDQAGTKRVNSLVAISDFVRKRIRTYLHADSKVIYPAVDTSWINPIGRYFKGGAFLYAGALVPYKRVDLIVEAFNSMGHELWIAGEGPEGKKLRRMANSNIRFLGRISDNDLAECYQYCRALVFAGVEDFGLIPVECMAAGRPVIGVYDGGLKESLRAVKPWSKIKGELQVRDPLSASFSADFKAGDLSGSLEANSRNYAELDISGATGVFFLGANGSSGVASLISSIEYFISHEEQFDPAACIAQAKRFSVHNFINAWRIHMAGLGLEGLRGIDPVEGLSIRFGSVAESKTKRVGNV